MASAASNSARKREEKSGVRSAVFRNIISPWKSAVEWNVVIGLARGSVECYSNARANNGKAN
jgi:hypothetical protein